MFSLADREKLSLLSVARRAITAAVECTSSNEAMSGDPALVRPRGAFVTLLKRGRLRGCIGQLLPEVSLAEVVAQCAWAAASKDPRFSPLRQEELAVVEIEISVLSEPYEIRRDEIQPGIHGLIVSREAKRGVLLPQVASQFGWNSLRFLEETTQKAGLSRHSWKKPNTRIQAFTAVVFSESSLVATAPGARNITSANHSSST